MFVDPGTLHDLEIAPTLSTRGPTLWSLVDRTNSRIGREALRQKLLTPPHSAEEILTLQSAHQALAADDVRYREILDSADPDGVEDYLGINWQLPADMGRLLWRRRWYRQYLQDVAEGQIKIRGLLAATSELCRRLSETDAVVLQAVGEEIATLLAKLEVRDLRRAAAAHQSSTAKRDFDQLARDRAKPALIALLACLGNVEAMWSLAAATREHGWAYPRPASRFAAAGLFHPFLGPHAVRNDLHLEHEVRVCFVTGPNMAGKSTFLKAAALAVFLAHIGCGVPATSLDFPIVGTIFSSVHIVDNLGAGESFYLAEVRRMRALALALSEHRSIFAVVDEPFRGTNVHDAAEATLATITRLANHPAALVLVASHVGEVVPALRDDPRIRLLHFAAEIRADQPHFDYQIRPGVSVQRLGMTLLKQERVLELLESSTQAANAKKV